MAISDRIWTYADGRWQAGNTPILGAADHATWLGTLVFDGARRLDGVTPDLDRHLQRVNDSAEVMGLSAVHTVADMMAICREGLAQFAPQEAIYIRPMIWSTEPAADMIGPDPASSRFAMCLEAIAMPAADAATTLTTTDFVRPTLRDALVNTKSASLYPNNARMLAQARRKGFGNALVCDQLGNVAETATANVFLVRDGEVFTPMPNGTFLNGITRQRVIGLLRDSGVRVHEAVLSLDDFRQADEVFTTGNLSKVMPVSRFDEREYGVGPVARRAREIYLDWAASTAA